MSIAIQNNIEILMFNILVMLLSHTRMTSIAVTFGLSVDANSILSTYMLINQ